MAEITRVLAAIVFTDVVGYSAKVQQDEDHTLALVARDIKVFSEVCKANQGRVVKNTGDGLLMFFPSLDSAVQAAAQMLQECDVSAKPAADRQAAIGQAEPQNQRLEHRIGIHLADVILQNDDIVGDGVNIAARLMGEAKPGTICISQSAFEVIKYRTKLQPTYIGPRRLKNIKDPVSAVLLQYPVQSSDAEKRPVGQNGQTGDNSGSGKPAPSIPKPLLVLVMLLPLLLMAGLTVYLTQFGKVTGRTTTSPSQDAALTHAADPVQTGLPLADTTRASAPASSVSAAVDLLAQVDVSHDRVMGQWSRGPAGVTCLAPDFSEVLDPRNAARLRIPIRREQIPATYDLRVSFTRQTGSDSVALLFQLPDGAPAAFEIDAWGMHLAGFQPLNGRNLNQQEQYRFNFTLDNNKQYEVVIRVRRDRVVALVDGQERLNLPLEGNRLTRSIWDLPEDYPMGVGAYKAQTLFHAVELTPVD